jgi:MEDS: MEthanogen/methylotroph, DcmR Sensory domain
VVIPFILEGLEKGEKAFHTVDPGRRERDAHLRQLMSAGVDVTAAQESGQLEVHDWTEMHLRGGRFDQDKTLALFEEVVR